MKYGHHSLKEMQERRGTFRRAHSLSRDPSPGAIMDEVEVDVKLFIKCRMCLVQQGVYQIAPSIKNKIKFCFDIDIEPFDGLPQLICKGCKSTLTEYHQIKTTFLEKQNILKENLFKKGFPVPSPQPSSGSELPVDTPIVTPVQTSPPIVNKQSWKNAYREHFVCIICNKTYLNRSSVQRHIKKHKKIVKRHKKVFKTYCTVQLNKIDEKPNITGCSNVVVYNQEKVIANKRNSGFHSVFIRKYHANVQSPNEKENNSSSVKRALSDSSDGEICKGKKKRISRLSTSSTQTTVLLDRADCDTSNNLPEPNPLHSANGPSPGLGGLINNDGTPSDCPPKNIHESDMSLRQRNQAKASIANYKTIQSIVAMCNKKHMKKVQSDNEMISNKPKICESSLKRKILSIGRKVLNKNGFGCTGLLRYMEHKDLEITWQPVIQATQNKGSNFVRIMPKIKTRETFETDNAGWKDLEEISFSDEGIINDQVDENNSSNSLEIPALRTDNEENIPCSSNTATEDLSDRVLNINTANDLYYKNKLLNKTPVPNPKQLPIKKIGIVETKPVIIPNETTEIQSPDVIGELENEQVENGNFCMPIITSTQSLSTNNIEDNTAKTDTIIDKPQPRIKVKPVSELMSERALSNQNTSENIWAAGLSCHLTDSMVYVSTPMSQSQAYEPNENLVTGDSNPANNKSPIGETDVNDAAELEFVTLDTLELPNTKTKTPFQYFKMVLLYHGIVLLELNEELPENFNCLVKFKLMLRQDTKQPLRLMFSLFCSNNTFCFHFRDSMLKTFDPSQLPAFWQWALLNVYKGDVVKKILHNAAKIDKVVHENTQNFLCLLKSINLIT